MTSSVALATVNIIVAHWVYAVVRLPMAKKALLPSEHVVDCGYTSSEILVEGTQQYGVRIIGLVAQDPRWQAHEQTGFAHGACTLDWNRKVAQCSQGKRVGNRHQG